MVGYKGLVLIRILITVSRTVYFDQQPEWAQFTNLVKTSILKTYTCNVTSIFKKKENKKADTIPVLIFKFHLQIVKVLFALSLSFFL